MDFKDLANRLADLLRDSFRWERRIGEAMLATLPPDVLKLPVRTQPEVGADDGARTVLDLIESLTPDDAAIENSVRDTLVMLGLERELYAA
jgi:hypothetical protein